MKLVYRVWNFVPVLVILLLCVCCSWCLVLWRVVVGRRKQLVQNLRGVGIRRANRPTSVKHSTSESWNDIRTLSETDVQQDECSTRACNCSLALSHLVVWGGQHRKCPWDSACTIKSTVQIQCRQICVTCLVLLGLIRCCRWLWCCNHLRSPCGLPNGFLRWVRRPFALCCGVPLSDIGDGLVSYSCCESPGGGMCNSMACLHQSACPLFMVSATCHINLSLFVSRRILFLGDIRCLFRFCRYCSLGLNLFP